MSERVKQFSAGAIIAGMAITFFVSVISWIGIQAAHVPELNIKLESEVKQLKMSIKGLNDTAHQTNDLLTTYTKYHTENLKRIMESLVNHKYKIERLEEKCDDFAGRCENHLVGNGTGK